MQKLFENNALSVTPCSITKWLKIQREDEENSMCQRVLKVMAESLLLMNYLIKTSQIRCCHLYCEVLKIFLIGFLIN